MTRRMVVGVALATSVACASASDNPDAEHMSMRNELDRLKVLAEDAWRAVADNEPNDEPYVGPTQEADDAVDACIRRIAVAPAHTMAGVAVKFMTLAVIDCGSTENPRFHDAPCQCGRIEQAH